MAPSCASIDNLKASVKAIYSARLTRTSRAVTYLGNIFQEIHDKLKETIKYHSRTSPSNVHSETQRPQRHKANVLRSGSVWLPSFPRDR